MRADKVLKLSDQTTKKINETISKAGKDLRTAMEIAGIDHMKVTLDLNFHSTGKFMGVIYSAFKMERVEIVYDQEVK